jgi:hypothetical protein
MLEHPMLMWLLHWRQGSKEIQTNTLASIRLKTPIKVIIRNNTMMMTEKRDPKKQIIQLKERVKIKTLVIRKMSHVINVERKGI